MSILIDGYCANGFAAVRDAVRHNLETGEEVGCSVAVMSDGKMVADVWGGFRDAARTRPWTRDTIGNPRSIVKSIGALCILRLASQGRLRLDDPVAVHWPEFGAAGKENLSIRTFLSQLAGLPFADGAPRGSMYSEGIVEAALASQAPEWPPGTQPCYHSFTYPVFCAELVRRVSGRTIHDYERDEISGPLGAEYWIGLEDHQLELCADFIETPGTPSNEGFKRNTASPLYRAWTPMALDETYNSERWRRSLFVGHGNARGLARIFGALACGGELDGVSIADPTILADATRPAWDGIDFMTKRHFRFGMGFLVSCPPFPYNGNPRSFGHIGTGGTIVFADPDRRLAVAYVPNRMYPSALQTPLAQRVIDAIGHCVD